MCQEEMLKSAKRDHKKRLENKIKQEIEDNDEFKELEYRTIEWDKDALYFSYEPSFLFIDEDEEAGAGGREGEFVCECCDPKKKKKQVSSEDVSEVEENEETDGLLSDTEDDADMSPCRSREDSPLGAAGAPTEKLPKPMAPGWFGKGRRRRGKVK
jgi:hypothetical protein